VKRTVLTLVAVAAILTACNRNQAEISHNVAENRQPAQTEVAQKSNPPAEENTNHDEWSSLPEYKTIIQYIDKKDYTFKTVTDNQSKRILILANPDGKKQYKSIFIKNTNRLKIVRLDGEEQIYNAVLENE